MEMTDRCAGVRGVSKPHREGAPRDTELFLRPLDQFQDVREVTICNFGNPFLMGVPDNYKVMFRIAIGPAVFGNEPLARALQDSFAVILEVSRAKGTRTFSGNSLDDPSVVW